MQRLWPPRFGNESTTEISDKVKPCFEAAVEPRQDGTKVRRDLARFVQPQLTTGPVDQLQVLVKRHKQTAAICQSPIGAALAGSLPGGQAVSLPGWC